MNTIDHVHISVRDRTAAELWYEKVLGLTRIKELEFWAVGGGPLTIQNIDKTVHLALFENKPSERPSTVAFEVGAEEFLEWQAHLNQVLNVPVELEDHSVAWSLYLKDPDGNPFEITTYEYQAVQSNLLTSDA